MLIDLLDAEFSVFGHPVLWREVVGNGFGLLSAIGGMRRVVWAWPVGIIGNALLFTVFLGGVFHTPQALDLYGQAGRQLMFIAVSVYGLVRWMRDSKRSGAAVLPRWGTARERTAMLVVAVVGTVVFAQLFGYLGSFGKWADAWIFTGSMLATFGMARGLTEFWLIWIAVDVVGVPLLIVAGFYPSAALYVVYAAFVAWGFAVWFRIQNKYIGQKMAS
ncbi:nicotinamide riboside transporter PnuC [Rhodococcoides yunnanense]|uniref:Nicotinamide riboside transporter PnuC n=1 Tax=Rhodococcoides yunnanense TaxID=278209 RepID=A0ABU4BFS2_9NOCA|nr:nicotinamide riboside transporter PnuC [Rhodococcus yunnanensis]MDV6262943.1 nicotinamide riboside transporter PnuC [Rhodococcus yunnanensis]